MPSRDALSQLPLHFEADRPTPARRSSWSVSQLVAEARSLVEQSIGTVWVEGEISNFRPSSAGNLYFTLKDDAAQISVVLFRRQALLLRFRPEDGLAVRLRGALSIYEQRGQLQLVAETLEPVGLGSLQLAFEQLRDRLRAEGLFDPDRKRPLPPYPRAVAIVTSPTGAVIRDFLHILRRRSPALSVLVVPVAVQGESAAAEIEAALKKLAQPGLPVPVELVVLARGGGSMEDMAAFNSERVARAIAASPLPVVSAIGHETDFTIADFVADLRAPTPSAAAELVTASLLDVTERVFELRRRLHRAARFQLLHARQGLTALPVSRLQQHLQRQLTARRQHLDESSDALASLVAQRLLASRRSLSQLHGHLLRRDPQRQLGLARTRLTGLRERLRSAALRRSHLAAQAHHSAHAALDRAIHHFLQTRRGQLERRGLQLAALSPLAVLERGYALAQTESGSILRDAAQLHPGDRVLTRLGRGSFASLVESIPQPAATEPQPDPTQRRKR